MSQMILHRDRCKACRYCIKACPKNALSESDEFNKKGYQPVVVDEEKCVQCGSCYIICPDYVFEIAE
ncbi:4Fe-4S binding protein [Candidatus Formimonas warabiya]|uniref:Oxidoreductase n=1 Tax=Formimonas warabiya TaxID=1761012 RepID=A0A3G1L0Y5_FORW1|nr:4Fe-4S binding protein [Candidatus Formimonas warabiya]ATW28145.1 oxidoreductase [Candidatus Formimonas warabiya]